MFCGRIKFYRKERWFAISSVGGNFNSIERQANGITT